MSKSGYGALSVAILGQACKDYEAAYHKENWKEMGKIKEWFSSDEFRNLELDVDGEEIVEILDRRLKMYGKISNY